MNPKSLNELAEHLFTKRGSLTSLWQEEAEQFYVERADFTVNRNLGDDFAAHLSSSYPLIVRRELGDQLGMMLRPTQKEWKHMRPKDQSIRDNASQRWLQWADATMTRAMYDPVAFFTKATKQADHDYATFGQAVISIELNRFRDALLYRTWHLKDVVWRENQDGQIDFVGRNWNVAVSDLIRLFPRADLDRKIHERNRKNPFDEIKVRHIVCSSELVDQNANGRPRFSIYYDCVHDKVIEIVPIWGRIYRMPRWLTVSGSQYAYSPAVVAALPEARLLQAMTLTILEAGEKAVNPPLVATIDAVKSDMQQFPGGVTWVAEEYDERLGEALRAMNIDVKGLPISLEMVQDSRAVLQQCFFLNKLRAFNPTEDPQMTAFQAGQIVQEYIRGALPLFEPMEMEYNGQICEETFEILYRNGAFGSPQDIPEPLRNAEIDFRFESPLHDAIEQQKGIKFLEFSQLVTTAVQLDPACAHIPDARVILRDVADGIRTPSKWLRPEMEVEERIDAAAEAQQQQALLDTMQQGSEVTKNIGTARRDAAQAAAVGG